MSAARRVLGLAIAAGVGYVAWRAIASGALGGGPTAGSSLEAIERGIHDVVGGKK